MNNKNILITVAAVIIVGGAAFFGGMKYGQSQRTVLSNTLRNGVNRNGSQGGQRFTMQNGERPVTGEITATDNTSITVKLPDGSSKIIILSETTAINKAVQGTKSDLATGNRVLVVGKANADGSVTAQNIQLNPQMRMFGGSSPQASPSTK